VLERELGLSDNEIDELARQGVLGLGPAVKAGAV
jgi:hypothetical protein